MPGHFPLIVCSPSMTDPLLVARMTSIAYCGAASLSVLCAWRARSRPSDLAMGCCRERTFWMGVTAAMVLLGLTRRLDIVSEVAATCRTLARNEGWYPERRAYQIFFVLMVGLSAGVFLGHAAYRLRRVQRHIFLALFILVFLATLTLVRAASFHQVDQVLYYPFWGIRFYWALELSGITLLAVSALCRLSRISDGS
jgi:hypothetical protein